MREHRDTQVHDLDRSNCRLECSSHARHSESLALQVHQVRRAQRVLHARLALRVHQVRRAQQVLHRSRAKHPIDCGAFASSLGHRRGPQLARQRHLGVGRGSQMARAVESTLGHHPGSAHHRRAFRKRSGLVTRGPQKTCLPRRGSFLWMLVCG